MGRNRDHDWFQNAMQLHEALQSVPHNQKKDFIESAAKEIGKATATLNKDLMAVRFIVSVSDDHQGFADNLQSLSSTFVTEISRIFRLNPQLAQDLSIRAINKDLSFAELKNIGSSMPTIVAPTKRPMFSHARRMKLLDWISQNFGRVFPAIENARAVLRRPDDYKRLPLYELAILGVEAGDSKPMTAAVGSILGEKRILDGIHSAELYLGLAFKFDHLIIAYHERHPEPEEIKMLKRVNACSGCNVVFVAHSDNDAQPKILR